MSAFSNRKVRVALLTAAAAAGLSHAAHAADYYVDPNYAGTNGAAYLGYTAAYNTINAALGAIPSGASPAAPNRLFMATGTYNTAQTTLASLSVSTKNLDLIGMTGNPNDVVITSTLDAAWNNGTSAIGTTGSATIQLKGNNVSVENVTFANSTDTPYIVSTGHQTVSPTGNYATGQTQTATSQGVALLLQGDQQAFKNCNFLGYQDTLYTKGGRTYFSNCSVSGDIDFIFANGTDVFNNSTINMDGDHSGGDITAASTDKRTSNGIIILNSTVTANSVHGNPVIDSLNAANVNGPAASSMYLGRPWGWTQTGGDASTVFINDKIPTAIKAAGWLNWDATEINPATTNNGGGNPGEDSRYAEFNSMDSSGNPLSVSGRVTWSHQLTAAEAAAYTPANIFSFEGATQYPWFGLGYSGTSTDGATFSYPALWGTRETNNETNTDLQVGNPTAYSDPSWVASLGNWNADSQLAALPNVPEPASVALVGVSSLLLMGRRRRAAADPA